MKKLKIVLLRNAHYINLGLVIKLDENGNRRKRDLTDEQRQKMAERLKKVRDNKNLTLIQ